MQAIPADLAQWVIELDFSDFWLSIAVLSALSGLSFWLMYTGFHRARVIENIPTAKIRSAPQGYVEFVGEAKSMDGPQLVSPLSKTDCLWYRYKIEELVYVARRVYWHVVDEGVSDDLFLLEDDTDQCIIDPEHAQIITDYKRRDWHGVEFRRHTEELIRESEPFYAMGLFRSVAQVEGKSIREQVSLLLREWKQDQKQLLKKYDHDRDGRISPQEWEQARIAATAEVKNRIKQHSGVKQLGMMQPSSQPDQPYILSTVPQDKLVKHYRNRALLGLAGFLVLGVIVVWALNIRML